MLDDLKYIHQRDGSDALGIAERQATQLTYKFDMPDLPGDFANVVYSGMGGSALAAILSRSWPGHKLPFEVSRQYHIPAYVSDKTLFIACSYSGNTEETLSALAEAEGRGAHIVIIAGGGKLADIAIEKGYPYLQVPKAEQPRYAVFYNLTALLTVLEAAGLIPEAEISAKLEKAAQFLTSAVKGWTATVPTQDNPAKKLALEMAGKSPVIYAGPLMSPVAYKWKISFNENAKNIAWWGELPEFNHNEFIGWSSHPIEKPYAVVDLRSNLEHPRVQKRFEVTERLLSGIRPSPHVVEVQGSNLLEQVVWAVAFGDFVTIYTALLNNVDPAPVDLVEKFKAELSK
jgi:glucose/mannose-6-phosphate isomerase